MASGTVRARIVFPKHVVDAVDDLVGQRKRSAFVAEAVAEKVERERFGRALKRTVGSLDRDAHPEWATGEKISAWVHDVRAIDNEISNRKLARFRSS